MRRFSDLPLVAQLLIPFLALMLFVGGFGVLVIVRDLSERGRTALEQDLSRRLLEARSAVRDRELYLVESANFASNLEGIAARLRAGDASGVTQLVRSVLALKTDLSLLAITSADGAGFVELSRDSTGKPVTSSGGSWTSYGFVADVLRGRAGSKASGFLESRGRKLLAIAAPVCPASGQCVPAGAAVVGLDLNRIVADVHAVSAGTGGARGVAILGQDGTVLARSGALIEGQTDAARAAPSLRTRKIDGVELASALAPFEVHGRRAGTIAVTVPTAPAYATARGAGTRLALVVVAVMAGVVALGVGLSRSILAQVKPLVATNRALGKGDLSARAAVLGEGELGELARGVNQMAEQLQAIYADLEMRVEQRTAEVRRLLKERTEFFASISHELRTPLAVILGQGKMMVDPKYPKDRRWTTTAGHTIVETTSQLIAVVNEILELARADAGRLETTLETVNVDSVLRELTPRFEDVARGGGGVHLSVVRPIERLAVRADPRRLHAVLLNLVDNAVKYTPAGGSVTVSVTPQDDHVSFAVADTGIGIPEDAKDLIFEPFFRVQGAAAQGGQASSGLGLALSKRLVEAQGGSIEFASVAGSGTTFTFTLPRVARRSRRSDRTKGDAVGGVTS